MNAEIWDIHCHLAGFPGRTAHERMAAMMALADRMQVARVCVFMGANFDYDPTPEKFRADNQEVLDAISHWHHRALGFAYLNPRHLDASLEELDRCVAQGPMVGVKLWVAARATDPAVQKIVQRAAALKAPIFQHSWLKITGNLPGESTPDDVAILARRNPEATIICGHAGGDWEQGIRAIRGCANVYADIGGGDPVAGCTEMAVRELGAERVLFGSDVGGRGWASQLAKVYGAAISDADKTRILGGNLRRILAPIFLAKGLST